MFTEQNTNQEAAKESPRYAIAVKRDQRGNEPSNWKDIVKETEGVTVLGDSSGKILLVEATAEGHEALKKALGDYCHIEEEIQFRTCIPGTLPGLPK